MATLTLNSPTIDAADERRTTREPEAVASAESTSVARKSLGQVLWIGIPLTMVAVCSIIIVMFVVGGTPLGEAIGYGTYLAFWIGGGFGAMISGAYYNHIHDGLDD